MPRRPVLICTWVLQVLVWLALGASPALSRAALLELRWATLQGASASDFLPARVVALPFSWDQVHHGESGEATFDLLVRLPTVPAEPYALLFPRLGNRAEVWFNGILLSRFGDPDAAGGDDHAKSPHYLLVPAQFLRTDNLLRVRIGADAGRRGGLAPVMFGPDHEVRDQYLRVYRRNVNAPLAVAAFSLLVGLVSLALWATQIESDAEGQPVRPRLYLWAGLSEICWAVHLGETAIIAPPLPWPQWGVLQSMAMAGWICGAALFCHHVAGWQSRASMRCVRWGAGLLFASAGPAALLSLSYGFTVAQTGWDVATLLLLVTYTSVYGAVAWRQRRAEPLLVAAAGALNILVGLRDGWVVRAGLQFADTSWMRYSSVLFGLALLCIVVMRFRTASAQARDLAATLAARVREKEQALAESYRELEQLAREQERAAERSRILSDMHDGVGAHISSAIHQLRSGRAAPDELLRTLHDSLDHLKLSIDAMSLPPGDLNVLLAGLRYRLEPRLRAAGITMEWQVGLVPPLDWVDTRVLRHLQFMVFEIVSNVLQHAGASTLCVTLQPQGTGGARLAFTDNGRGFPPDRDPSSGLRTLRQRALAIHADLEVQSRPGHTRVQLTLPPQVSVHPP